MSNFQPVIKWTGSKRSQSEEIIQYFPKEIDTYYEPCCGGASILRELLDNVESGNIKVNTFIISDLNEDLMNLWQIIKDNPDDLYNSYKELWEEMNQVDDILYKQNYYNNIRDRFNKSHNPKDFFFILRTCYNGMVRYNAKNEFNTSFHLNRNGIHPTKIKTIIDEWSFLLKKYNVQFQTSDYKNIIPENKNDFLYMDPPYNKTNGLYYGKLNNDELFNYLTELKCNYILSFDGISGQDNHTFSVPKNLYNQHIYISSGNSSFKRLKNTNKHSNVFESLYIKNN